MMINMEEKTCVKVVLIGVGGYGKFYLREMEKRTQDPSVILEGVCDVMPDVEKQNPFLLEHGIPVYREIEQFYEEHDADLAVISTPIPLHFEQVVKCLKHGSDVLIEKPLCSSVEEALEMAQIEKETGHFVAVGYQMNYSPVTRELKNRILNGEFGNPVVLKTIHGFKRGKAYYHRNNWAGKRTLHGHLVNDSPVNNSNAHQFQNMLFLLGDQMDHSAAVTEVKAELYRTDPEVENFDTAALCVRTASGVPVWYYTTHNCLHEELGPVSEFHFEKAVIRLNPERIDHEHGNYQICWKDGRIEEAGAMPESGESFKLDEAITCAKKNQNGEKQHPVCTIQAALSHLETVRRLSELEICDIDRDMVEEEHINGVIYYHVKNIEKVFSDCFDQGKYPSQVMSGWK